MSYTINPNAKNKWARNAENTMDLSLETDASSVYLDNGRTLEQELGEGSMVSNMATVDSSMSKVIDGTLDGAYESGVMYGRSLVNLYGGQQVKEMNSTDRFLNLNTPYPLASSKTYLLIVDVKSIILAGYNVGVRLQDGNNYTTITTTTGIQKYKFVASGSPTLRLYMDSHDVSNGSMATVQNIMLLEYQEGMENWDIPYFEGLCDVKMPILRNVGKNLFNGELEMGGYTGSSGLPYDSDIRVRSVEKIFLPKETYTLSSDGATKTIFTIYDLDGVFKKEFVSNNSSCTITLNEDCMVHICVENKKLLNSHIQLEQGSNVTSYEDHKTNILRTSEEIVLRKVGGVQDTYNLLTGEYVKHIGEIVLSGSSSEQWNFSSLSSDRTKAGFYILISNITPQPKVGSVTVNNKLPLLPGGAWGSKSHEGCVIGSDALAIVVNTSKLSTPDVGGIRTYLQSNPITVQYELAKPITTIVESLTTPFAYENGHIILESGYEGQSLLPTLEYSTVVNKTGLVENVAKTIQRQEKQLTMLEQMLIQNIINLDYNNTLLTLKNEMEEML